MSSIPAIQSSELPSNDTTVGPILIGGAVSFFLYGCTCLQAFIYQQRYPNDRRSVKLVVSALWIIDTFDVALTLQICYFYMVTNHLNETAIFSPTWSLKLHVFVTSLSDFIVRAMFVRRIYAVSHRNLAIAVIIAALSLLDLVIGTVITAKAFKIATFQGLTAVATLFNVNFGTNIAADACVAACLSYFLWVNRTGIQRTDSLVNKLVLYTVTTGFITVIDAAMGLITYIISPTTLIFVAFYLNLSKFYVNSYFASLNVRKDLLGPVQTQNLVSIQLSGATTNAQMPSFRHPDSVTDSPVDNISTKITTLGTLDSSNSSGGRTGGRSSITSKTAIEIETPTSPTPLVRHSFKRSRTNSLDKIEDEDRSFVDVCSVVNRGVDEDPEMGLRVEVDSDVYRGNVDPEQAYTDMGLRRHRRDHSLSDVERRISPSLAEGRRSNVSGR